jgi:hypothetical protein
MKNLGWVDDAMLVYVTKSKTNQDQSRRKDPFHIYANPIEPVICNVLALGVYFLLHPNQSNEQFLFDGESQNARYSSIQRSFCNSENGKKLLGIYGLEPSDIGTHSVRKGAATFACSVSVSGPSIVSVCVRAGWTLGDIQDRYLKYESAGDQFVGRILSGLPQNESGFACVPPHFEDGDEDVMRALFKYFPSYTSSNLGRLIRFCVASVVYHREFLRKTLPKNHKLFHTSLFLNGVVDKRAENVKSELTSSLNITGIPANIKIIDGLKSVVQAVSGISKEVVNELEVTLERNAVSRGFMTATSFKNMMKDILDQHIPAPTTPIDAHIEEEEKQNNVLHLWDGRIHSLPESFGQGLSLWFRGNPGEGIPPLRLISTKDVNSRNKQKYYSD